MMCNFWIDCFYETFSKCFFSLSFTLSLNSSFSGETVFYLYFGNFKRTFYFIHLTRNICINFVTSFTSIVLSEMWSLYIKDMLLRLMMKSISIVIPSVHLIICLFAYVFVYYFASKLS